VGTADFGRNCQASGKGDLVSFDGENEILELLEKATNTFHVFYHCESNEKEAIQATFRGISNYFLEQDIHVEGFVPGLLAMSVPTDVDDTELSAIMGACPHPISFNPPHGGNDGILGEQQGNS
jgi:hypothetical protein